jgi:Barstar (barnase inhibitor)
MTKNVQIDGAKIRDWNSFHHQFVEKLGFPDFNGRNMDAWIDCMTSVDSPEDHLSSLHVAPGEMLIVCVSGARGLKIRCAEIYNALVECSAFVNRRRTENGAPAVLVLTFSA